MLDRSTAIVRVHRRIIDARFRVFDLEDLSVQGAARFTGARVQCGHVFIFFDAGFVIGGPVGFAVNVGCFRPDQPFSVLVGLAHFGG